MTAHPSPATEPRKACELYTNLLVLYLLIDGEFPRPTFDLNGLLRHFGFGDVDNSVDVKGDLLGVGGPALVAEAVVVFSIGQGSEGVIIGGDGGLEVLAVALGILDLDV